MRRRALLTTVAVTVLGGCIEGSRSGNREAGDGDSMGTDEARTQTNTETPRQRFEKARQSEAFSDIQTATGLDNGEVGKRARVHLDAGEYTNFSFKVAERSRLHIQGQVADGGPIDLYVMTVAQFNEYQRESAAVAAETSIEARRTIDFTHRLQPDDYLLVFDNTSLGPATPDGTVQIEFEFVLGPGVDSTSPANT